MGFIRAFIRLILKGTMTISVLVLGAGGFFAYLNDHIWTTLACGLALILILVLGICLVKVLKHA